MRKTVVGEMTTSAGDAATEPIPHAQIHKAADQGWSTKAFGAAIATLIATIGQNMGSDSTTGHVMVWVSPSLAMLVPPVCDFILQWWGYVGDKRDYTEARKELVTLLDAPETSERHKKEMRLTLERAEAAWATKQYERTNRRKKLG
ncbi:hypothetical protein [Streptomyces sp. NPDC001422]|uniref:hypothetical protein n=1 Tax=Streptomyces sp. NPDC001422 TaxID=3364575 RepID=UPI0036CCEC37